MPTPGPQVRKEGGGDVLTVDTAGTLAVATGATVDNIAIRRRFVCEVVPSGTAGVASAVTKRLFSPAVACTVKAVTVQPVGTCAGHATSNFTLSVRNIGVGATGSTDIATLALTTGNALVTNVPKAFTMATTASVAALESVVFYQTLASSGIDYPALQVTVEFDVVN